MIVTTGFFVCFCSSETSSVCSSSDAGLFTNDEGRQGNSCPLICCWGISFTFFTNTGKELWLKRDREGSMGERPVAGRG